MNIKMKKLMSLLMCCVMLFGMLPVEAFATETGAETGIAAEENVAEVPAEVAPSADEPLVEEPLVEDPVVEEPVAEERVVEELVFEEVVKVEKILDAEGPSLAETFLSRIRELQAKAEALAEKEVVSNEDCAEIYNDLMKINDEVIAAKAAGTITSEEYDAVYSAIGSVMMVLAGYGFDPYAAEAIADLTIPQGSSADYKASGVNGNTKFTISPDTDDIKVERTGNNAVRVSVDENCASGTYTISYRSKNQTYSFTVAVTESTSGDDGEDDGQIRVYVYVSSKNSSGDSWRNNLEFQELIGLTVCDGNGYFPAGEISLDADFLDGKNADKEGEGLITSEQDWSDLLAALGEMNTSTLVDGYNNANPNPANFSENRGNAVYQYLSQAEGYTGTNYGWGSMHTALFRWHKLPYSSDVERSLGFEDQSVKYHLDLCFNTNKITFITGNNGIAGGVAKDGIKVDERVYITGSEIQEPRNLQIPDGYEFMGYYKDADFTIPWDGIGTPLNKNETVYIKITEVDNAVINYVVAEGVGKVDPENEAFNPITGSPAGSTATPGDDYTFVGWYSDESCTRLVSSDAVFVPNKPDGGWDAYKTYIYYAKFVPATADLIINKIFVGLPEGSEPTVTIFVKDSEGVTVGKVNLNASEPSGTVSGLRIGETYTVEEDADSAAVEKYILTTTYSAAEGRVMITGDADVVTVSNTYTFAVVDISGKKIWEDNQDQDGVRPDSITIKLMNGLEVVETKVVTAEDNWSWSFDNLPKYKDGKAIVYTITEDAVSGYTTEISGYNVINTHIPEQTSVTVTKVWDDADNQDGIRPTEVTITLLAGGEDTGKTLILNAGNNWTGSFADLDKYAAGEEIVYSVVEVAVEGYETVITGGQTDGYTVTNTHTPETVEVSGSKTWNDNNNQDGARPASITINLVKGGKIIDSKTVTAADGWAWTFENLDKFENGVEITYSFTENAVEDYSTSYEGNTVINTHTPAQTSVTVTKAWEDNNDQDGIRPNDVTIKLLANGEETGRTLTLNAENHWTGSFTELDKFENGVAIVYTVDELEVNGYKTVITGDQTAGYTVANTHTPEIVKVEGTKIWVDNNNQDGKRPASITINLLANGKVIKTVTVTEADGWAWSFTELPKFEDHGKEITYTITENAVAEYETEVNGYNVTNTHKIEKTEVDVSKVWKDNNDQDGIRPNAVTIKLLADGEDTGKTLVLNAGNNWTGSFTDLDKYAAGKEITYSVKELTVAGYTSAITGNQAEGYTVTNTHIPAVVEISGAKTWKDNNDQDGTRPASITVNLVKDGKVIATKTVTAADRWSWSFEGLPKYENHGAEIIYSITENAVEDYTTTYNGYDVINTHTPEKTSVTVTKAWKDNNDQDGIRPNDVTIKLLANGKDTRKTLVLNAANGWTGSFTGLDKFAEGKEVVYTVEELNVEGYTSVITGSKAAGFTVTNTHEPETLDISGKKTWDDEDNQDGKRPTSITIRLLANGVEVDRITVTDAEGWDWSFTDLPKYENHGKEITYTITEDSVEGYTASYNGFDVTNKYTPEETSVTVTKSWQDNNDQDGIRPEKITVNLLANGEKTASAELTAEGNWTYTFAELDVYANGEKIVYTVEEEAVEGYETVITGDASKGFTVTNSHTAETMEVSGKKTWEDDNNRDGKRPASITVRLLANGKEVAVATVTAEDAWSFKFTNLPKFEAGKEIVYTVTEDAVAGYSVEYSDKNFDITNKYTPGKTSITVTKRWIDGNNHDSIRPSSVTIYLYAGDVKVAELKLTAKDNWTGVFDNLHIYENGKAIEYSISEKSVRGYNATFTGSAQHGFTVTNTHNIIPKTGDESNLPMYVSMFGASVSALAVLMFLAKSKKKGKNAR